MRRELKETEIGIEYIKDLFQKTFAKGLGLQRVSAPMVVLSNTGVNDHLNGTEQPVGFQMKMTGDRAEVVQSLAKWKRMALADYGFKRGEGLYTDMNAIRPDEVMDQLHSIYVDQWDWEMAIGKKDRTIQYLEGVVKKIYASIRKTEVAVCKKFPKLKKPYLPKDIAFIHSEDLLTMYPELGPRDRESAICKELGAVFIIGIGGLLADGVAHDGRASDYDDWTTPTGGGHHGLNGDIIVWNPVLDSAMELSSMGIRVDNEALLKQLEIRDEPQKANLPFHQRLLNDELPLSIGGGIGQSRLCMLYLRKRHVGEVQASIWPDDMRVREGQRLL